MHPETKWTARWSHHPSIIEAKKILSSIIICKGHIDCFLAVSDIVTGFLQNETYCKFQKLSVKLAIRQKTTQIAV